MIISTFNIQNDFKKYKKSKSKEIYNYLISNHIDILGLQEVFYMCDYDLKKILKPNFKMLGKYRFRLKLLYFTSNEKTPIITSHPIISSKTYRLPFRPSHLRRVITNVVINYDGNQISIYNTHLESTIDEVKHKQLDKIYEIIVNDNNPKIIMGDFNLKNNSPLFKLFEKKLKNLNINKIILNEKTFKESKGNREIDHIFVSSEFIVTNKQVIKNLEISDHYPVIAELQLKKDY